MKTIPFVFTTTDIQLILRALKKLDNNDDFFNLPEDQQQALEPLEFSLVNALYPPTPSKLNVTGKPLTPNE